MSVSTFSARVGVGDGDGVRSTKGHTLLKSKRSDTGTGTHLIPCLEVTLIGIGHAVAVVLILENARRGAPIPKHHSTRRDKDTLKSKEGKSDKISKKGERVIHRLK